MNHKTGLLSLLLIGSYCISAALAGTNNIGHIRSLVVAAKEEAAKLRCRNAGMMLDNLMFLQDKAEFRALQDELVNSWKMAVLNLDSIADTDMEKAIVLCSCWKLSEEDFVEFLSSTASLVEEGKLDRQLFGWCQNPFASDLSGFLMQNYRDPAVQDIIMRSRVIFQDQPDRVEYYSRMLTGESLRKLEEFEAPMQREQAKISALEAGQELIPKTPIAQNTTQAVPAEPEEVSTHSVRQFEEEAVKVAPTEPDQPEEQKRGVSLPLVIGVVAALACVGVWLFQKRAL